MKNIELLLNKNYPEKRYKKKAFFVKYFNNKYMAMIFTSTKKIEHPTLYGVSVFCDTTLKEILDFLNMYFQYYENSHIPIIFHLGRYMWQIN